jgi:hypothetical protein
MRQRLRLAVGVLDAGSVFSDFMMVFGDVKMKKYKRMGNALVLRVGRIHCNTIDCSCLILPILPVSKEYVIVVFIICAENRV